MSPVPPPPQNAAPNTPNPPPPPGPSTSMSTAQPGPIHLSKQRHLLILTPAENKLAAYPPDPKEDDEPVKPTTAWECIYVYTFIVKFLHGQGPPINGLLCTQDWENALLDPKFNQIQYDILRRLLELLRPKTVGTITPENITALLAEVISYFCVIDKFTVFWEEANQTNRSMYRNEGDDFFLFSWETKLITYRQLVDWCLCYSKLKDIIDISWELKYQRKKKKTNKTMAAEFAPPDADDPMSMSSLQFFPLGQDSKRVRFWAVDETPRLYTSYNPWKTFSTMQAVSNSMEEYQNVVSNLRASLPENAFSPKAKLTRWEKEQVKLIHLLEKRVPDIEKHDGAITARKAQKAKEAERKLRKAEEGERRRQLVTSRTRSRTKLANTEDTGDVEMTNGATFDQLPNTRKRKRDTSVDVVADEVDELEIDSPAAVIDKPPLMSSSARGKVRLREARAGKSTEPSEDDMELQPPDPDNEVSQDQSEASDNYDPSGDESVASAPAVKNQRRKSSGHGERAFKATVPKDVPPPPEGSRRSSRLRREEAPPFVDIDDVEGLNTRPSKKRRLGTDREQTQTETSTTSGAVGKNDEEVDVASSTTAMDNDTRHPSPAQDLKGGTLSRKGEMMEQDEVPPTTVQEA